MLSKLSQRRKAKKAAKALEKHPVLGAVLKHLRTSLAAQPLGDDKSEAGQLTLCMNILRDVEQSINVAEPIQETRLRAFHMMNETAMLAVLIIPPPPATDNSGLRHYDGVSGELKDYIPRLADAENELRDFFRRMKPTPVTRDTMVAAITTRHDIRNLVLSSYNIARCKLGDYKKDPTRDWFKPCYISQCIHKEHVYRQKLGLPPSILGKYADLRALTHSSWSLRIQDGVKDLRGEWEKTWNETFHEPSPYLIDPDRLKDSLWE